MICTPFAVFRLPANDSPPLLTCFLLIAPSRLFLRHRDSEIVHRTNGVFSSLCCHPQLGGFDTAFRVSLRICLFRSEHGGKEVFFDVPVTPASNLFEFLLPVGLTVRFRADVLFHPLPPLPTWVSTAHDLSACPLTPDCCYECVFSFCSVLSHPP